MDWTPARSARLEILWNEGHSASEIGRRMEITKNAVIGKAHRMKLPARPSPILERGTGAKPRPQTPRAGLVTLPALSSVTAQTREPNPIAPTARNTPDRVKAGARATMAMPVQIVAALEPKPVVALSSQPCCWPIGEPRVKGFRFCGASSLRGRPYCPEHHDTAHIKPSQAPASIRRAGHMVKVT